MKQKNFARIRFKNQRKSSAVQKIAAENPKNYVTTFFTI
jgi:hypothetical protein